VSRFVLYYRETMLGDITSATRDEGAWMVGDIALSNAAQQFQDFFSYHVAEEDVTLSREDLQDLLNEKNWSVVNAETGVGKGIEPPAIYDDGTIYWRWS